MRKEHIKSIFLFLLLVIIFNLIAVPFVENHAVSTKNDELGIGVAFKPLISFFALLLMQLMPLSFLCLVAVSVILKRNDSNEISKRKSLNNTKDNSIGTDIV